MNNLNHFDAIIIGGGPAGLTAGIYLSRARHKTLVVNEGTPGGQLVLTHEIANYPGVETTSGFQLANTMKNQAKKFGCTIRSGVGIRQVDLKGEHKVLTTSDGSSYSSDVIILAPGGRPRPLGVTGEESLRGKGVSYCATCDGDFFTGKEVVVVGGGNSALEEAVSLTRYASKVTIVHQFDHFQAFPHAIKEAMENPKISFLLETVVTDLQGGEKLEAVRLKNLKTGEITVYKADGIFVFIGYLPNTEFLSDKIELNHKGEIIADADMKTNVPGVYAAGDCIAKRYRQVTTAVSDGTIAALSAGEFIVSKKTMPEPAIQELV
jgi:thioredoxin reductase (NADPH)